MRIGTPDASAVADRRADARVGNGHDDVRVDRADSRASSRPRLGAHLVDALAEHVAVGTREVDVLEDALLRLRRRRKRLDRPQAVRR